MQVLARRQLVIERRILEDDADRLPHGVLPRGHIKSIKGGSAEVGLSSVQSMLMVVVLPAPLGPRKPKISLRPTVKLTSSTAMKPLNLRVRCSTSITGPALTGGRLAAAAAWAAPAAPAFARAHFSSLRAISSILVSLAMARETNFVTCSAFITLSELPCMPEKNQQLVARLDVQLLSGVGGITTCPAHPLWLSPRTAGPARLPWSSDSILVLCVISMIIHINGIDLINQRYRSINSIPGLSLFNFPQTGNLNSRYWLLESVEAGIWRVFDKGGLAGLGSAFTFARGLNAVLARQ